MPPQNQSSNNGNKSNNQVKIKMHNPNNNKKHDQQQKNKNTSTNRKWTQTICRFLLIATCCLSFYNQMHIARLMLEYPSYDSYNVAKPGEGVTDFEKSICFFISIFCIVGAYCAIIDDRLNYKHHMLMGLILSSLMILPILCGGELKSSYKVLTDRIRLLNRDIGFWQLDLIIKKKFDPDSEPYMELANSFQKLGCCGITNATQWTDGLRFKRNFELGYDFYPASCCVSYLPRICAPDKMCACRPYDEGCLTVTFEAMQEYFWQRYLQVADLLLLSLFSYICYRKKTKSATSGRKQKSSNISNV